MTRTNGTMRERTKGTWELRVYLGRDPLTGNPRQATRTFHGTEKAAGVELAKMVAGNADGEIAAGGGVTFGQALDMWLEWVEANRSAVTAKGYRQSVDLHVRPYLGTRKVTKLTRVIVNEHLKAMADRGAGAATLHNVHANIQGCLTWCIDADLVKGRNVAKNATIPRVEAKPEKAPPTPEQVSAIIAAVDDPQIAAMLDVMASTGLRRGDVFGLRWSDFDGAGLHLRRSVVLAGGRPVVSPNPTKKGKVRRVALDDGSVAALEAIRADQTRIADGLGASPPADGWILSRDGMGHDFRDPNTMTRMVARATDKLVATGQLPRRYGPHDLRRYMVTQAVAGGFDPTTVSNRGGHGVEMALGTYSYGTDANDQALADYMHGLRGGTVPARLACVKCGTDVLPKAKFCADCGAPLTNRKAS